MFTKLSFDNRIKIVKVALACIALAALFFLLVTPLYVEKIGLKIVDALLSSVSILFPCLILRLWLDRNPLIPASDFGSLRRISLLSIFAICCHPGIPIFLELLFMGADFLSAIMLTIPIRVAISLTMLYIVYLQTLNKMEANMEIDPMESISEENIADAEALETKEENQLLDRIAVKVRDKIVVIPINQLYYLKADGDYVQLHTAEAFYLKEQTMKYFENVLPNHLFVRIHRSYIVNVEMISGIEQYGKQTRQVILKNGDKILVSVNGYKALRQKLEL